MADTQGLRERESSCSGACCLRLCCNHAYNNILCSHASYVAMQAAGHDSSNADQERPQIIARHMMHSSAIYALQPCLVCRLLMRRRAQ